MTGFELEPDALSIARADVDRVHDALTRALGDVAASVTSLVGDGWRGVAATAFLDGYDEWRRGAEQVLAALAATGESLTVTARAYAASDDAAAEAHHRLRAGLDGAGGGR